MNNNGLLSTDDKDTARISCDQLFQMEFVNDGEPKCQTAVHSNDLTAISVRSVHRGSCRGLLKHLNKLVMYNGHPHFLKNCADLLAVSLTAIYQKSCEDSSLPMDWKTAYVILLFNKKSAHLTIAERCTPTN